MKKVLRIIEVITVGSKFKTAVLWFFILSIIVILDLSHTFNTTLEHLEYSSVSYLLFTIRFSSVELEESTFKISLIEIKRTQKMKTLSKIGKVIGSIVIPSLSVAYFSFYILSLIVIVMATRDSTPWILQYFGKFGIVVATIMVTYYIWLIAIIPALLIEKLIKKDEQ